MRRRFFVERFDGRQARLTGEQAHHLGRVLRAQPGQLYELSDGRDVWLGRVTQVHREAIEFVLLEPVAAAAPGLHVVLLLAIVKFDRFEWCLEKATELGVSEIVPLAAARSERHLVVAAARRAARWRKILLESAQQARRVAPPVLHAAMVPEAAFAQAHHDRTALAVLFSERRDAPPLRAVLANRPVGTAMLAIGPEGGWTDAELELARQTGFAEASLGPRILRTETAVIAALAILHYALGSEG